MSLKPQTIPAIPEAPKHITRAAFPNGNIYSKMRDEQGYLLLRQDIALTLDLVVRSIVLVK